MFTNPKRIGRWIAIAVVIGLFCSAEARAKKPPRPGGGGADYNLVVLAPSGVQATGSLAGDLDELGNVVGVYSDSENDRNGFYYNRTEDSYLLFGPGVGVWGLNNLGEMVGTDDNTGKGLYWNSPDDENPGALSPLAGHQTSEASRINDTGIITGSSQGIAVAWKVNETGVVSAPIELPFLHGDVNGLVRGVSEQNIDGISRIVGYSGELGSFERAIMWEVAIDANGAPFLHSGPTELGSLYEINSAALGVNLNGDIVGRSTKELSPWPFVKPAGQPMQPLPGISKATHGVAVGINDLGQMVGRQGYLFHHAPIAKAVLWPDAGSVIDLNKKVALGRDEELEIAFAINNAGDILAHGYFPNITGGDAGVLLIPSGAIVSIVPEPSTFGLSTLAMMGLGLGMRWRRRG